jgi:hypothetical protein
MLPLQVAGQKQQTAVMPHTRSPTFNAHFEFFNVTVPDTLQVQVRLAAANTAVGDECAACRFKRNRWVLLAAVQLSDQH